MRFSRVCAFGFILFATAFGLVGCFTVGPGSGSGTGDARKIEGTYQSDQGKVVIFNNDGSYKLYYKVDDFQAKKDADSEAGYTILKKEIIFKDDEGNEIPERGTLSEDDSSFSWEKFPGQTFKK